MAGRYAVNCLFFNVFLCLSSLEPTSVLSSEQVDSTNTDTYLRPQRVSSNREPVKWINLELFMPTRPSSGADAGPMGLKRQRTVVEQTGDTWVVLDVQSCLENPANGSDDSTKRPETSKSVDGKEGPGEMFASCIRIYLGNKSAMVGATEQRETQTAAVLAVVGYIGHGGSDSSVPTHHDIVARRAAEIDGESEPGQRAGGAQA